MRLLNQSDRAARPRPPRHAGGDAGARPRRASAAPSGMVLVTGPTGSGKTTTLYAALTELNSPERKIITVEDPVEYRLPGINQVQVHEKIELAFERVLRSALRQDPDVILVGEMRDQDTAEIGLRAAMTGHMVLSTLHTNDAVEHADPPARHGRAALHGGDVAAAGDRAAPGAGRSATSCAQPHEPTAQESAWLLQLARRRRRRRPRYRRGRGCSRCNGTGYAGRTGVYEMLEMTQPLVRGRQRRLAGRVRAPGARADGRRDLARATPRSLVGQGRTTVEEAMRDRDPDRDRGRSRWPIFAYSARDAGGELRPGRARGRQRRRGRRRADRRRHHAGATSKPAARRAAPAVATETRRLAARRQGRPDRRAAVQPPDVHAAQGRRADHARARRACRNRPPTGDGRRHPADVRESLDGGRELSPSLARQHRRLLGVLRRDGAGRRADRPPRGSVPAPVPPPRVREAHARPGEAGAALPELRRRRDGRGDRHHQHVRDPGLRRRCSTASAPSCR